MSNGIAADQASGALDAPQAEQQLDGLGATVQSLSGLAQAVIDSPVGYRPDATGRKPYAAIAAMQGTPTDMGNAIAAGRFAVVASASIDLTV